METVTVEIINTKAMKLLKELEELDIIKIHNSKINQNSKEKSLKYRGRLKSSTANRLLKEVEKSRKEWEERFPTK